MRAKHEDGHVRMARDNALAKRLGKILDRILFQANLKYEVRVDEANKPLLWISSSR